MPLREMDNQEEIKERGWIVQTVQDGSKSEYWSILREVAMEWLKRENAALDSYKKVGIRNDEDRAKYNRVVDRIEYIKLFLNINEDIINHNMGFIDKLKLKVNPIIQKVESFCKEVVNR